MKKSPGITTQKNTERRRTTITLSAAFALVIAGVIAFIGFYNSYIDNTLYAERLNQMREVTIQLFSGLEDVIKNQWRIVDEQCRTLQDEQPKTWDELHDFIDKQYYLSDLESVKSNIVAVDENGAYYTQDGSQGLIPEREYLLDDVKRLSYVTNSLTINETRMVFLRQLDNPITIQDSDGEFVLKYFGISQNMEELNPYFECAAYGGNNSVYVIDNNGLKLFSSSSSSGDILQGYNVLTTLSEMSYLHGTSLNDALSELAENNLAYSNALLDGTEIFYSLYKMDNAAWTLIFLVPSEYVATNTVDLVNMTIQLVLMFAVVLIIVSVAVITWVMRTQQKSALNAERENSAKLEKLNQELKSASKAKTDFLSNMSHDIRTPMNAIVGMTKLIEHEKNDPDKLDIYLDKIQISSRHLLSLINDVLDMSKIESGDVSLNNDSVSLSDEVAQVENIIRPQAEERGHHFVIRVHNLVHEYVVCDAVRLRQVIINLLSNAVKYTHNGGSISYDIEELPCDVPDSAKLKFTVKDDGFGMTPEFVKHIFEPFVRAENSTTNKVQGTGLGMAITKSIIDMMGGTITIDSQLNKGSTFEVTVTFPIDYSVEHNADVSSVLLVSDDDVLTSNMRAAFSERNAEFSSTQNILDAAGMIEKQNIDVILLNGYLHEPTLADTIKMLRETAKSDILIFCCDYAKLEQEIGALKKTGADGMIPRPFFFSKFIHAIKDKRESKDSTEENTSILSGMNFLCAEDNDLNAEILTALLDIAGAKCTIYPNGEELVKAFADVKEGDYDAILMDVQMPIMNGFAATKAIRSGDNPLGKKIPIIAMTANAFSSDIQDCLDAGMDAHIAKPLEVPVLEKVVKSFILPPPPPDEV